MEFEKLNRRPWGKGRGKIVSERDANHKRLLNTENKLKAAGGSEGGWVKWVMGMREGTFQDEHLVSYTRDDTLGSTPEAKTTLYVN